MGAALAVALLACACGGKDEGARPTPDAAVSVPERPLPERVVGKWQMIKEEPADGKGDFFGQERRLLELRANGTYHAENYISSWNDTWELDGEELVLHRLRLGGGDVIASIPDPDHPTEPLVVNTGRPTEEVDEVERARVERADAETLVLVEDLPEAYLRDGPPRKVRNTYRRVSEAELGPMLGKRQVISAPVAGAYAAAYDYRMTKYPTMEIYVRRSIGGRARLELGTDGQVEGCIGVASGRYHSESRYSSVDGKDHTEEDEDRWLVGLRGSWRVEQERALVRIDRFWADTCDTSAGEGDVRGPIELDCVTVAPNERLPVRTLTCRVTGDFRLLEEICLNPADTERAGPFTLQIEPRGRLSPDTGRPWLLLGAAPGLKVESRDDRDAKTPVVGFSAGKVDLVERNYIKREPPRAPTP